MLNRFFGDCGFFGGGLWIIVLFFLFLAFGETWSEIDMCNWIPFLILLLILCCSSGMFDCEDACEC